MRQRKARVELPGGRTQPRCASATGTISLAMAMALLIIGALDGGSATARDALALSRVQTTNAAQHEPALRLAQRPAPRRGGGRAGGSGGGIGIGIGALILQEGLRAAERQRERERARARARRPERRPKRQSEFPERQRTVAPVCRNGAVSGRRCVCRGGRERVRTGRNAYFCQARRANLKVAKPEPVRPPSVRRPRVKWPSAARPRRRSTKVDALSGFGALPPLPVPLPPLPVPPRIPAVAADDPVPPFVPDEVLITVTAGTSDTGIRQLADAYGLTVLDTQQSALLGERIVRLGTAPAQSIPAVVQQLANAPGVLAAQPNHLYHKPNPAAAAVPAPGPAPGQLPGPGPGPIPGPIPGGGSGPNPGAGPAPQGAVGLQYALLKVGAQEANALARGQGIVVAVIDSGIDVSHADLAGVVGDAFDAIGDRSTQGDNHATAVAGIIGGRGLVKGVAPAARILDVRAFKPGTRGGPALATSFVLLSGIDWAASRGARVFNLSFAGPRDPLLHKAIKAVSARRMMIVAAAGNGGASAAPAFPAAYDEVIAVTATDVSDNLYEKANRGPYIALAAPGVDVLAPITGNAHSMHSGTSFAAAHISGILALMLQRTPTVSAKHALDVLEKAARDLGPPGRDEQFGAGEVNAARALRALR